LRQRRLQESVVNAQTNIESHGDGRFVQAEEEARQKENDMRRKNTSERKKMSSRTKRKVGKAIEKGQKSSKQKNQRIDR
jgi:hypothetical protein